MQFKKVAGYLTDKAKSVEVTITHKEPNPEFYAEVPILIRGGPKLLLKLNANVVQPEVFIVQEAFDQFRNPNLCLFLESFWIYPLRQTYGSQNHLLTGPDPETS